VDYEKIKGRGFMRLLEFLPDGKTVQVRTYSPTRKEINSPITKGEKPLQPRELEEFSFQLRAASGHESMLATTTPAEPPKEIIPGQENAPKPEEVIHLNGEGQLVIDTNDKAGGKLSPDLVKGREEVSFEVWVTPTTNRYGWNNVLVFSGEKNDRFYYCFRTFGKHRAELVRHGHNEKVYNRRAQATVGKPLHIVVTYDQEGRDGKPLLTSYLDGRSTGSIVTSIKLSELGLSSGRIGPFAGNFDELRIYDYPLNAKEVAGNYEAGPDKVNVAAGP